MQQVVLRTSLPLECEASGIHIPGQQGFDGRALRLMLIVNQMLAEEGMDAAVQSLNEHRMGLLPRA